MGTGKLPVVKDAPVTPGLDEPTVRELAVLLHDLCDAFRCDRSDQVHLPALPAAGCEAMRAIVETPGITVAQLAATLDKQVSNISGLVRELIARGLVTRHHDAADRRYAYLYPTDAAIADKDRLEASWGRQLQIVLETAPSEEAQHLVSAIPTLRRVTSALQSIAKQTR
jgi:DNA-binding MarR family transcriptional regulator